MIHPPPYMTMEIIHKRLGIAKRYCLREVVQICFRLQPLFLEDKWWQEYFLPCIFPHKNFRKDDSCLYLSFFSSVLLPLFLLDNKSGWCFYAIYIGCCLYHKLCLFFFFRYYHSCIHYIKGIATVKNSLLQHLIIWPVRWVVGLLLIFS